MGISVSDAPVGRLIDGRYRIESMLAQGGMATVYRALDTRLDRAVALKVMHAELAADDEFVERFIREAHAAARLSDPNVVAVFDQGEDAGAVYLAMEYVEGQTLRQALREFDRLEVAVALEAIESVLSALSAAHKAGIVHRDVKPENVLIGNDGKVKVADFGLARATGNPANDTRGLLLGTVNYISPEQALGEPATARSDVYSAGIVLFEMLTGSVPHTGPTDFVIVRSHIDEDVPPPSSLVPVPASVDELVLTATSRDPDSRFADASRYLAATRRALAGLDGYDDVGAMSMAESRASAGVGVAEALEVTQQHVPEWDTSTSAAVPPPPPAHHTRVIGAGPTVDSPVRRADRRDRMDERRRAEELRARQPNWRKTALFVTVLLIAISVAIGAWWMGVGRWDSTPSLLDLTPEQAQAKAETEGFTLVNGGEIHSESIEAGRIVSTEPEPGAQILNEGEITYVVSLGPERYEVPSLMGMTEEQAVAALEAVNLTADVTEKHHDTAPAGEVFEQGIPPGDAVRADTAVPISISKGRQPVDVPDVTGQKFSDAKKTLEELGLVVERVEQPHPNVQSGFVISQSVSGEQIFKGDTVTLVVAKGHKLKVPNVIGRPLREARQILEQAGLTVEPHSAFPGVEPNPNRTVLRTDPAPNSDVHPGQAIKVFVL